jgi:hypothetical protein
LLKCVGAVLEHDTVSALKDLRGVVWRAIANFIVDSSGTATKAQNEPAATVLGLITDFCESDLSKRSEEKLLAESLVMDGLSMHEDVGVMESPPASGTNEETTLNLQAAAASIKKVLQAWGDSRAVHVADDLHFQKVRRYFLTFAEAKHGICKAALKESVASLESSVAAKVEHLEKVNGGSSVQNEPRS